MALEAEENKQGSHLVELAGSGYQIVEGEPDITGWTVVDGLNRMIGEVYDVLFDPETRSVRYIIVDLAENEQDVDTDKKVLVPIGIAELRDGYDEADDTEAVEDAEDTDDLDQDDDIYDDEVVFLPTCTIEQLLSLPPYQEGELSPEHELAIRYVFEKPLTGISVPYQRETFYQHQHFNNNISAGNGAPYDNQQGINREGDNTTGNGTDIHRL
ncbi:hypothetical protein DJ568_00410 [Mucilaginibacter hurinus]|uniref:PRC-barrel domain-containing protein n=1 Tax=Mucilaginibacter hurinus TaxID=2201324 RepID=A0A367GSE2_9SPHI|nr:PRC-barrel domain-containing protein [Mucilaginibacter hurinus]RCH56357.1 hypothetical protein DJ568_00410 [Mucilaginibacter hurinus]